jgi:anti-anti-sigma factor
VTEVADLRGDRLLVVHGELDIATAPELVELLDRFRRLNHAVALDLAEVTFMDSTGLTTLMDAHRAAEDNGWSFEIKRASPAVQRVFDLAGVARLLDG